MWYVIRTETGREEQVMEEIRNLIPHDKYEECFSMKRENLCHSGGRLKVVTERMFPGYIILVTDNPGFFYKELKKIPCYARVLGREEEEFFPIREEEQEFIQSLMDEEKGDYLVKLSPVIVDKNGDFLRVGGVLQKYRRYIIKKRNRLRYALIQMELFGQEREIYLGIRLEGDFGESRDEFLAEFKNDSQADINGGSDINKKEMEARLAEQGICEGASVYVTEGSFAGRVGLVTDISPAKEMITIETEFFHERQSIHLDWKTGMEVVERE